MSAPYPVALYPGCPCFACDSLTWDEWHLERGIPQRMTLCPTCGDKRCRGAIHHDRHGEPSARVPHEPDRRQQR